MNNAEKPALSNSMIQHPGITKLEYFLAHSTWEPSKDDVSFECQRDRNLNPYGEPHKPRQRSLSEIIADLKIKHAEEILNRIHLNAPQP